MTLHKEEHIQVNKSGDLVQKKRVVATGPSNMTVFMSRSTRLLWFFVSVISLLIIFRFILLAIGANATSSFVNVIYSLTAVLVAPFQFIASNITYNGGVIEVASIFAFFVYPLVGWGIIRLLWIIFSSTGRTRQETTVEYNS